MTILEQLKRDEGMRRTAYQDSLGVWTVGVGHNLAVPLSDAAIEQILADDVRCTHGATVGQLEAEPVFYLMTRGLPRAEAERMVVDGFFAPVLERIPFERVRDRFRAMIDAKMG